MKRYAVLAVALSVMFPLSALAFGHFSNSNGHNNSHERNNQGSGNGSGGGGNRGGNNTGDGGSNVGGNTPPPVPPTPISPPPVVSPVSTPAAGEVRFIAYTTGYGWPDNTPAGGAISNGVIHSTVGGTGTFADPITVAVGHSIINGKDILDYPAGTKFYVPNLRRYFIVEDACGDGNTPQNGPCHTGYQGHVWIDLWVGGQGLSSSGTLACEDTITDLHEVIENPASTYEVVSGPVYNGTCATQFGDVIVSI